MRVVFLDRERFPNGGYKTVWNVSDLHAVFPDLHILHNNWIIRVDQKMRRLVDHGFYFFNDRLGTCQWSWANTAEPYGPAVYTSILSV